jgi:YcaO-like protein with predicted kinase domain
MTLGIGGATRVSKEMVGGATTRDPEPGATKRFREGTERAEPPEATLERVRPLMGPLGITRAANITGLDRIGVPVYAVYRPNARSLSVAQGKGLTPIAAEVSGLMESVETYHAENVLAPLLLGSHAELRQKHRTVDVTGLPRLSSSCFHENLRILWTAGVNLFDGQKMLVPYELVHLDFRLPLPPGSGAFFMSSNGLASGNHLMEATSHAICELIERDANSLWHAAPASLQRERRVDLATVDDAACRSVLNQLEDAGMDVSAWETTSELGIASFLCSIVDRDPHDVRPMPPVGGSGCHPRRAIALLRALTEAVQGRLTIISGSRDDISSVSFDDRYAMQRARSAREVDAAAPASRSFLGAPDVQHESFEEDVRWQLFRLAEAGMTQVVTVNLTRPEFGVPVVRVIIPQLEAMSEVPGYVPGARARRQMERATS